MNIRTDILLRTYIAFGLIVLFAFAVMAKLIYIQFVEGDKWKTMSKKFSTKFINIEASRGNIYSADGSLLATSVPEYELRMDLLAAGIDTDAEFYEKVDSLSDRLASYFGDRSPNQYSRLLRDARRDSVRYLLIKRRVSYQQLKEIRQFPIFNLGRYKGGLIAIQQNKRVLPFQSLAMRTIGYKNENVQPVGLEGAYASYISGESGKRLMQRISGGTWVPVNHDVEFASKEGADIISTIDINIQDVATRALRKQLISSSADHGCVILMEVATGEVRAIANLTQGQDGQYQEKLNYAIGESAEPGSTFKLASYMTLLDQHKIDTNTRVDCQGGQYRLYNHTIKDSHLGTGVLTAKRAFEESSNVGIAKLVYQHYKSNPKEFTEGLYRLHLNEKLNLQIPGEGSPLVKTPKSKSWSGLTLPQMAYGYELKMTPLQMLTFYNAVANQGEMISPIFVKEIRRLGNTIEHFKARVIERNICSDETLEKVKKMLEGVVSEGTGKSFYKNLMYKVAGKTGTAQVANGALGYKIKRSYMASFCGYFPADKPKYSMIVVINNPQGDYYSAQIAGPVFKEIADKVYSSDPQMFDAMQQVKIASNLQPDTKQGQEKAKKNVYKALGLKYGKQIDTQNENRDHGMRYKEGIVPNVMGMGLKDALYIVGNSGLKPAVSGSGRVVRQSIEAGLSINKGQTINLELQ